MTTYVSHAGETYPADDLRWKSDTGALLDLSFTPSFDASALDGRAPIMWRYREAIPIADDTNVVSFDEGFTPLTPHAIDGRRILLKQDHLFPTGSYKDRGASVLISQAKALGVDSVVEDSSGNAGAAIAAYCARAGIRCDIYVPDSTSPAKLVQIRGYGAELHLVPGTREDTAAAALEAAEGRFYASHVWNPYFFHGTKTFAYEVWEQLGRRSPEEILIPTGNGTLLIGARIGFGELLEAGLTDRMPRLVAVQAENCAPLSQLFEGNQPALPTAATKAEGIAIAAPARGEQIVDIVKETGGEVVTVSESEIDAAHREAAAAGWFVEPTCAAGLAAARKRGTIDGDVVVPLTGHGLKAAGKP